MKRLIETREFEDDAGRKLADLVAAGQPYRSDPLRKRRVLVGVLRQRRGTSLLSLRAAVVGLLFIGGTASAAALGSRWLGTRAAPPPGPTPAPAPLTVPAPSARPATPRAVQAPEVEAVETPDVPAVETAKPKPAPAPRRQKQEDPTQVIEAIRALRRDKDPERAEALLKQYAKRNPRGALAEEALALTIEAAVARGDARAVTYARRYLARYPQGIHRDFAAKVASGGR